MFEQFKVYAYLTVIFRSLENKEENKIIIEETGKLELKEKDCEEFAMKIGEKSKEELIRFVDNAIESLQNKALEQISDEEDSLDELLHRRAGEVFI